MRTVISPLLPVTCALLGMTMMSMILWWGYCIARQVNDSIKSGVMRDARFTGGFSGL